MGLSHALGHKLGAKYGIPHGITSVSEITPYTDGILTSLEFQCLTLAPTVLLKSEVASEEDKRALAAALYQLHEPSTGSIEGDVRRLATLINKYVKINFYAFIAVLKLLVNSLVISLGLQSTIAQYNVPKEDLTSLAKDALGRDDDPQLPKVVKLLESLYSPLEL